MIDRAKAAGCSALVVTLDLQVLGQRHKDIKNGLSTPPKPSLKNWLNLATKLTWCWHMSRSKHRTFGNIVGHVADVKDIRSLSSWTAEQFDLGLNWDLIKQIRDYWQGKLILKGIMEVEDVLLALEYGADAIVVSNHGDWQLDGALASIEALPAIVDAVGDRMEVWFDGGIRGGQDVLRAWALGAKGTLIGRAYIYGLGAYGQAGVKRSLEIIHKELDISMAFCGHTQLHHVGKDILVAHTCPLAQPSN